MIRKTMIRLAVFTALGSLMLATAAAAGPEWTFGPENQGTLKFEYKGQFQLVARDDGSGYQNDENTYHFNFRRNRLALMGTYGEVMSVYVQTEFTEDFNVGTLAVADQDQGSEFQMLDAVVRFDLHPAFKVSVGKFKYNFTRENLESCENPLTLDRSLYIRAPFVTTRDAGVAVWGNLYGDRLQYRADLMEGRKAVGYATAPKSNFRYSVRGHVSLLEPESEYGYKGTYLGKKKVFTLGAAYQVEPNAVFTDTVTKLGVAHYKGWTADAYAEYPLEGVGTFTFGSAYEKVDFDESYLTLHPELGALGLNGEKNGWYVKGGYLLPKHPVQLFGRFEQWRFAMLNNVYDQGVDWFGAGVNYFVRDQQLKLTFEASRTSFDRTGTFDGLQGAGLTTRDFNTFTTQLQVVF
jgi:hypothetical protein